MYLEHFGLRNLPFGLTPDTKFYCALPGHQDTLNVLLVALKNGEGFIKVTGEVGTGKTLLCRKLLSLLPEKDFFTAYIPNPDQSPAGLRRSLAQELGLEVSASMDQTEIFERLNARLLELYAQGKKVVLLIDEAQTLSADGLETLRLLSNLETESSKLLHLILFGQPELDATLKRPELRQLAQRIAFSTQLRRLSREEVANYLFHRLAAAGFSYRQLFSPSACHLLYRASRGIPRILNILSHKALLVAFGRGEPYVHRKDVRFAIKDTDFAARGWWQQQKWWWAILGLTAVIALSAASRMIKL